MVSRDSGGLASDCTGARASRSHSSPRCMQRRALSMEILIRAICSGARVLRRVSTMKSLIVPLAHHVLMFGALNARVEAASTWP